MDLSPAMDHSPGGSVILYAGSTGSASPSPGSPSSGYQTQSPSSQSQPSSPEDFSFAEIGPLKQRAGVGCGTGSSNHNNNGSHNAGTGSTGGPNTGSSATPSNARLVFQFPEVNGASVAAAVTPTMASGGQGSYSHPMVAKRPCGFTGTFTKTGGMVLLCKVCGDIASGFHYGVHACEGCKGFFRRSIQQNIHYKMCVKNENCLIMRMNRNRCQHCRFKKCLSVGMSRDAVRFGRIPKREKQRLLDEMQSYMNSLNEASPPSCMEIDSSPPPAENPPSPAESQSPEEAIGAISQAYRNIFEEKPDVKPIINHNNNNNNLNNSINASPARFHGNSQSQDSKHPQSHPHSHQQQQQSFHCQQPTTTSTSYHHHQAPSPARCPVTHRDSNGMLDNSRYNSHQESSNQGQSQSQCPVSHNYLTNQNSRPTTTTTNGEAQTQGATTCPFRLGGGAKVLACPLNASPVSPAGRSSQQVWEAFSQCFTPAVKEVVEFAKSIPGFQALSQHDQVMLLKAGTFQVLMVRFSSLFNAKEQTVTFLNGQTYPLASLRAMGMGSLLGSMFEFSEKLSSMGLEPDEMALFMAVVLLSADRAGIADMMAVEQLQEGLIGALRALVTRRRPDDSSIFSKLLLRLPDLRTLNTLHSDKLLAFRIDS